MPRVLIVEDDPAVARLLERILAHQGLEASSFADGESAEAVWSAGEIDLVLLDAMLPGIDGLTLTRRMRERGDRTPVILVSAREVAAMQQAAEEANVDAYLAKPFSHDELLALVRRFLPDR